MISTTSFLSPWVVYLPQILCIQRWFLVPNESQVVHKGSFIWILTSRFISLIFLSTSVPLKILSLYLFCGFENFMPPFGCFRFWTATRFPEVVCPRYDPVKEKLLGKKIACNSFNINNKNFDAYLKLQTKSTELP